ITGSFKDVENLINIGCSIIAVDGTLRNRGGLTGPGFINEIKKRYNAVIMADVALYDEGMLCAEAGADCISSTLSGYTPDTKHYPLNKPDFMLVENLAKSLQIPIIAEGRINTPAYAAEMIRLGAWSVVVGTAITRPAVITSWFVDAINKAEKNQNE
ncbi:MAG: N-acetylmannosamine-6-phosphate 2-epimerase, partial [Ignavibacteriales bacterium]